VSPWSALCRLSSEGRRTTIVSPSTATASSAWINRLISPFGPFTVIRVPSSWVVTPLGMGIGFLPIRDMGAASYQTSASSSPPMRAVRAGLVGGRSHVAYRQEANPHSQGRHHPARRDADYREGPEGRDQPVDPRRAGRGGGGRDDRRTAAFRREPA